MLFAACAVSLQHDGRHLNGGELVFWRPGRHLPGLNYGNSRTS